MSGFLHFYMFNNAVSKLLLYVRLLWSVIFALYLIICAFLFLYLFLIKRKNFSTVNGISFTLCNNVLHTIICPWISLRRFNVEGRPSSFLAGELKFDLDNEILLKCTHFLCSDLFSRLLLLNFHSGAPQTIFAYYLILI